MPNRHLILCGGTSLSSRKKEWREAKATQLAIRRDTGNVNLRIADITRRLTTKIPDIELDLLDIAAYVYSADQATTRGGMKEINYSVWYRDFRFEIAVRQPDFWKLPAVRDELSRTLNELSGDTFEFVFSRLKDPPSVEDYFDFGADTGVKVDAVMLFSGGLDSFGGAVEEVLVRNRKVALVSHRPNSKIDARQRALVGDITSRLPDPATAPIHVPILVNKAKDLGSDYTQRTRSFLYATLAAVVARLFGCDGIRFYENGITSLNLPISPQVASTRATRTTHPMVLAGFRRLFSEVFQREFRVENPFFWKTKTDILIDIKNKGYSRLCAYTSSCAHTWEQTKMHPHCGRCSQCLDRRLVALAADYGDHEDPAEMYKLDVLRGTREESDRLLAESYVETVNKIDGITTATQFCVEYPEVARSLNHLDGTADRVAQEIFGLYRRHAQQVCGALDAAGRSSISELRRHELPPTCLLSIAFVGSRKLVESLSTSKEETVVSEKVARPIDPIDVLANTHGLDVKDERPSVDGAWFCDDPPKDGRFRFGPLEGPIKDLSQWMAMDQRTIKRLNGETSWWVKKVHGKKFAAWFSTPERYAAANQKRIVAESENSAK